MKYTPYLFALILLAGCKVNIDQPTPVATSATTLTGTTGSSSDKTQTTSGAATSTASAGSTTPTTNANSGVSADANPAATPPTSSPAVLTTADLEKQSGYNKFRIYQLSTLKTATLGINGQKLTAWIADNDYKRDEGLMFVRDGDIKPNQGMIFAFPTAKEQAFWMKHTYIPLDIAYIGADKVVVSTATMQPFDEKNTPSNGKSMYVLEMVRGTIQRLGIQKGTKIDIPPTVVAQDPPASVPPQMSLGGR